MVSRGGKDHPVMPRSPERTRLAVAVEAHAAARHQLERVRQARRREADRFFTELEPAVAKAKRALVEARAVNPRALVELVLTGEALPDDGVRAELQLEAAQRELDAAERKLTASSEVRKLLRDEENRVEQILAIAAPSLDEAVNAVIRAEAAALVPPFVECRRRFAEAAAAFLALPPAATPPGVIGAQRVGDVVVTIAASTRVPNPAMEAWLIALREDPDAVLPDVLAPEPPKAA
jgi:hypothetical protein